MFYFEKLVRNISLKVLSIACHYFSHLSGSICIPRRKNNTSFKANYQLTYFENSAHPVNVSSTRTSDNQTGQCLVNMEDRLDFPFQRFQVGLHPFCNMWSGVIMLQNHIVVSLRV